MTEKSELPLERSEEPTQPEEIAGHEERQETPANEATRRAAEILAKALSEAEAALISTPKEPQPPPQSPSPPDTSKHHRRAWGEEMQSVIRALTEHFDRTLDRMGEERKLLAEEMQSTVRSLREYLDRVEDRMDHDRRLLTEQLSTLSRNVERLERRLDEVPTRQMGTGTGGETPLTATPTAPPEEVAEPAFIPGGEGLTVVISSVPGFQGLMEAQRALMRLPAIEGASVERYFDGEARIVLTLREPITASLIVETLSQSAEQAVQIEESRPDALRLRVRFEGAGS
jgi:hypothetical protein